MANKTRVHDMMINNPILRQFMVKLNKTARQQQKLQFPDFNLSIPILTLQPGRKYHRIVKSNYWRGQTKNISHHSAFAFIDDEGLIWKASGWKCPAKNFPRARYTDDILNIWRKIRGY